MLIVWLTGAPSDTPEPGAGSVAPDAAARTAAVPAPVVPAPAPALAAAAAPPMAAPPAWLGRAERPHAEVGPAASPATEVAMSRPPSTGSAPAREAAPVHGGSLAIHAINYTAETRGRTVTLSVGGRTVTLHEGQSAAGVEVQLILPEAVYVRQGNEVVMLGSDG
jgi:hypothetical protein